MAPHTASLHARQDLPAPPDEGGWLAMGWWLVTAGTVAGLLILVGSPAGPSETLAHPISTALRYASIALALLIFLSGWNHHGRASSREMVLAFGFLGVGLLDFVQALSLPGMPDFVTPNTPDKAQALCIASRLLAAGTLLARIVMPERRFEQSHRAGWLALTLGTTLLLSGMLVAGQMPLPALFDNTGARTLSSMLIDSVVMTVLLVTLFLIVLRDEHHSWHGALLTLAVSALMVSELHYLLRDRMHDLAYLLALTFEACAGVALYRLAHLRNLRMPWLQLQRLQRSLDDKQRFLDTLIREAPDGVLVVDQNGRIEAVNATLLRDFGYTHEAELLGQPVEVLLPPEDRARHAREREAYSRAPYSRAMGSMNTIHGLRRDGTLLPVEISLGSTVLEGRRCAVAFVRNISARRRLEDERAHLLDVLEESPDWIFQCDPDLRLTYANPAARLAFGLGRTPVQLAELFDQVSLTLPPAALFAGAMRNGVFSGESHLRCCGRGRVPVSMVIVAHRDGDGVLERYSLIARDLSERVGWEQQLAHNATHDALTGLPNRVLLTERIEQAIDQARGSGRLAALLFLDLDNFKLINDTLGHNAGDEVLVAVSRALLATLRQGDTLARFGGDEFVVVAPGLRSAEDASGIARKLLDTLDRPVQLGDKLVSANASIGICLIPADADSAEAALSHADQAMYRVKRSGRGHFRLFAPELDADTHLDAELASALKRAIRGDGELALHYQPEVAIRDGRILCVEALLRWRTPEHGAIGPDRFVRLAEETGLILELGQWVMTQACRQLADWQRQGLDVRMAINISVHELKQPDFAERVQAIVREHGLDCAALELEVTETALVQSLDSTADNLSRLRAAGMRIALDDFGTGYSSLAHLRTLPIDKLKIDRDFVHEISRTRNNRYIVEALVGLARQLGIEVIAEGVETHADLEVLAHLGCEMVQGWLFHRSLDGEACTALIRERHAPGAAR